MQIPGQLAQSRFLGDRLKVGTRRQTFKGTPAAIPVLGQTRLQSPASGPAPGSSRPPAPYAPPAGNNPPVTAHPHCCNCLSGYGRRVRTLQPALFPAFPGSGRSELPSLSGKSAAKGQIPLPSLPVTQPKLQDQDVLYWSSFTLLSIYTACGV